MSSEFLIQVIHKESGQVVRWAPGLEVEKEFERELLSRVESKGVGLFKSSKHVVKDVMEALRELIHELKAQV